MRPVRLGRNTLGVLVAPIKQTTLKVRIGHLWGQRPAQAQLSGTIQIAPKGGAPDRKARRNLTGRQTLS